MEGKLYLCNGLYYFLAFEAEVSTSYYIVQNTNQFTP